MRDDKRPQQVAIDIPEADGQFMVKMRRCVSRRGDMKVAIEIR